MICPYCGTDIKQGIIIVKYIDDLGMGIAMADTYKNLVFGKYTFHSKNLNNINYTILDNSKTTQTITLTDAQPVVTLTFVYTKLNER